MPYPDDVDPQPQPAQVQAPIASRYSVAAAAIVAIAISLVSAPESVAQSDLQLIFADDGTSGTWQDKWFLDGPANVDYTDDGMVFDASPGSGEAVLWAKPIVRGDVRIEYDYTHIDDASNPYVVILFIQAQGTGDRAADISTWQRPVASYPIYHGEMSNYSITYDNAAQHRAGAAQPRPGCRGRVQIRGHVRARRDVPHHGREIGRGLLDDRNERAHRGVAHLRLHGQRVQGAIEEGRIGLRHMDDRSSRYGNFKIWASEYVGGGGHVAGSESGSGSG